MVIKRDSYLNELIPRKWNGMIKVVSGMRRSGKSYLLFRMFVAHLKASGVDLNSTVVRPSAGPEATLLELTLA